MGITIYDVSRLSGVSTATVSRVYSNPERVREATRQKVYEAAKALNYSPNAIASSMARQRADRIAFLICKDRASIMDEFYAAICSGIMRTVNVTELQLLISTADEWSEASGANRTKQIEGVILGGDAKLSLVSEFRRQNIPVVLVNDLIPGHELPAVIADEAGGVGAAIARFAETGRTRIGLLMGRFSPFISSSRYRAFMDCMKERGLAVRDEWIRMCEPEVGSAAAAAEEIFRQKELPNAIFAANDKIAAGAFKAASRYGIRIPEDIAVIGCDDSTLCDVVDPELTSIHINAVQMGEQAVKKLMDILDGKETDRPLVETVPESLHVRASA